jgi:hypothetical protein
MVVVVTGMCTCIDANMHNLMVITTMGSRDFCLFRYTFNEEGNSSEHGEFKS